MREDNNLIRILLARSASLVLAVLLALAFALAPATKSKAAYTYTVRLYAGKQGTFAFGAKQTLLSQNSSLSSGDIKASGSMIIISNVPYEQRLTLYQTGMVTVSNKSKYVVKGIRKSGRDNDTIDNSSVVIKENTDYVIGYKMVDELVEYTIRYVDGDNNTIATEETFYGNAGDSIVVAFPYIEGYKPRAYNGKITLSSDEDENIFYFPYRKLTATEVTKEEVIEENDNNTTNNTNNNTNTNNTNTNTNTNTDTGTNAGTAGDEDDDGGDTGGGNSEPDDLIDIGNNEIPQAEYPSDDGSEEATTEDLGGPEIDDSDEDEKSMSPFMKGLLALLALAIAIAIGFAIYKSRNSGKKGTGKGKSGAGKAGAGGKKAASAGAKNPGSSGAKKPGSSGTKKAGSAGAKKPAGSSGKKPAGAAPKKPAGSSGKKPEGPAK